MKHSFLSKPLACFLALVLLFGGTAKELVHQFAGHTDTVHAHGASRKGLCIEPQHHHCDFLHFTLPDFSAPPALVFSFGEKITRPAIRHGAAPHLWLVRSASFISGRGPPRPGFTT